MSQSVSFPSDADYLTFMYSLKTKLCECVCECECVCLLTIGWSVCMLIVHRWREKALKYETAYPVIKFDGYMTSNY